jgi:hypothetical protein
MLAPREAVVGGGDATAVFVVTDGRAVRTPVEVAPFGDAQVEIVSGLADGATIVAASPSRLADGSQVEVQP